MRYLRWAIPAIVSLMLIGCNTALTPAPELGSTAVQSLDGVAFQPPIGTSEILGQFDPGVSLEIAIFVRNTNTLIASYSTAAGSIRVVNEPDREYYIANWQSTRLGRNEPNKHLRIEVRSEGLSASTEPACNGGVTEENGCLAFVDIEVGKAPPKKPLRDTYFVLHGQTVPIKVHIKKDSAEVPDRLSDLETVSGGTFIDDGRNCAINEFNMPGQGVRALGAGVRALGAGVRALGAVGGLVALGSGGTNNEPNALRLVEPYEVGTWIQSEITASAQNVAILVADDFRALDGTIVYRLDASVFDLSSLVNSTTEDVEAFLESLLEGSFSHGALVMFQIAEALEGAGYSEEISSLGEAFRVFVKNGHAVAVAAVDTEGLDTDFIASRIADALNAINFYNGYGADLHQITINMSFAIVPCSLLEDFEASGFETFEEYVDALADVNQIAEAFYDELVELLVTPLEPSSGSEPLLNLIETCEIIILGARQNGAVLTSSGTYGIAPSQVRIDVPLYDLPYWLPDWESLMQWPEEYNLPAWNYCGDASIVYVASSGNFALDYPMYPAAWPLVVGSSSQDAIEPSGYSTDKSWFANSGEVMAPGALFKLNGMDSQWAVGYLGTSFSAPVVSVYTALDLAQEIPRCGLSNTSWLAHKDEMFYNISLPNAINRYCSP